MSQRIKHGAKAVLPVIDAPPDGNTVGLDLTTYDSAACPGRPKDWHARIALVGGASAELTLYVKDEEGWGIAADHGALGLLSGEALASDKTYFLSLLGLGPFTQAVLVKANGVGVAVTAKLAPILDGLLG